MNVNTYLSKKRFGDSNPMNRVIDNMLPQVESKPIELPSRKKQRIANELKEKFNFSHGGKKKQKKNKKKGGKK